MRRILAAVVLAAAAAAAWALPEPDPSPPPLAGVVIDRLGIDSPLDAAIWYCPWVQSVTDRDTVLSLVSIHPAAAEATFPVLVPGEPPDTAAATLTGPGGATITLSDLAQRGHSPGFIEFSGGPTAVSATVAGDILAADACVARGTEEWFFVGGSTMTGDELTLRLFNPFPESATVVVSGFSEIGVEALGEFSPLSVPARSWRDIEFPELLRQRQTLAVSVRVQRGLVVPAMSFGRDGDADWWSGTGLSTDWEIPIARFGEGNDAALVVVNPGAIPAGVEIELYGTNGGDRTLHAVDIEPGSPARFDLAEIETEVVAARISASTPVAAGVVALGPSGTAVSSGLPERGRTWLLPGATAAGGRAASVWLLNTGDEALVVTVSRITPRDTFNVNEILDPGTVTRLPVVGLDTLGYLVRSSDPFSAAWTLTGPSGMAYVPGQLVPDDA